LQAADSAVFSKYKHFSKRKFLAISIGKPKNSEDSMNLRKLSLMGAALLMAVPAFANTYYGGFEDLKGGDYDYNDIVFTLSGSGLTLNTQDGKWFNKPTTLSTSTAFWNNTSWDGPKENIGYCIYGGGNCGTGLSSTAQYLANKSSKSSKSPLT
jgi:hypothetical protein